MREEAAQRVLLVRAIEEADRGGRLVTPQERARATAATRETAAGDRAAALERRADRLLEGAAPHAPWIGAVLRATRFPPALIWVLPVLAGAAGVLTDALGPARRVNILSIPLLGLILWNLGVYALLAVLWLARGQRRASPQRAVPPASSGSWADIVIAWAGWRGRRQVGARTEEARVFGQAVSGYLARWRRLASPLLAARVRFLLHLGAALLAGGMLLGTYARGIAFEYQATWESTFLGPREVHAVLVALFGPASLLLGEPIPSAAALAGLRAPAAGEAAPWVHRYALTLLLVVIGPRTVLAGAAFARARRLAADLPLDLGEPYFMRLIAGSPPLARVDVLPYGMKLESRAEEALRGLLRGVVGASADVRMEREAAYGVEPGDVLRPTPTAEPDRGLESWRTVVFSLAQSPEHEVHGELLARLADWVAGGDPGRRRGLAVVNASSYRGRLAGTGAEAQRVAERQRAWDQVAQGVGTTVVHLDLEGNATDDEVLGRIRRGVWPPLASASETWPSPAR